MNTVFGTVTVSETGRGVSGLAVAAFDVTPPEPVPTAQKKSSRKAAGRSLPRPLRDAAQVFVRLASALTDADGRFKIEYTSRATGDATVKPVNLLVTVSAPEEAAAPRPPLFVAPDLRQGASPVEAYQVRIPAADLLKAGIPLPGEAIDGVAESPVLMRERLLARATREVAVAGAEQEARTLKVAKARSDMAGFRTQIRPVLAEKLSSGGASRSSATFVPADASVHTIHGQVLDADLKDVISRGGVRPKSIARLALTAEQARALRGKLDSESKIAAEELRALLGNANAGGGPSYVRTEPADEIRRSPSDREREALEALQGRHSRRPAEAHTDRSGNGVDAIKTSDIPRFLARLVDTVTSPEEGVLAGLEPRATQERVSQNIQGLAFKPSPADSPAFYDFRNLQVAFRHVWQEAIDEGVLDIAEDAYNEIVLAGGQPETPGIIIDPVRGMRREAAALSAALGSTMAGSVSGLPPTLAARGRRDFGGLAAQLGMLDGLLTACAAPPDAGGERLSSLLAELEQRLQEPYAFTTFAANRRERSVNFGILVTYRQRWEPTAYQAGKLAKTITLAPKETQKYTRTVRRQRKRAEREVENHLSIRKEEMSTTSRAEEEIVRKANTKTNFQMSAESTTGAAGTPGSTTKTSFDRDATQTSETVKRNFRESVVKASQELKDELTVEVNTEDTDAFESTESGEISNPNDELAVTFLFYELQRRYRVSERIHALNEVVLVAQEMPAPHEINEAWLVSHDWILRRALLDDSFAPALNYLSQRVVGDRAALAEMQTNVAQQRQLIGELKGELAVVRTRMATYRNLLERSLLQAARKKHGGGGGLFSGIPLVGSAVNLVEDAIDAVGDFIHPDMPEVGDSRQDTIKEAIQRTADEERDLLMRVEREVTALNALTESYAKALAENLNQRTQILRLRTHVMQNATHYMRAVWDHEPPDQRYLRLHEVPVPTFSHKRWYRFDKVQPVPGDLTGYAHRAVRPNGQGTAIYEAEVLTDSARLETKPLAQVADLDNLLGYFGNYMMFPLKESNPLTDFMAEPYVLRGFEELVDPDDVGNWTLDEFADYVCRLKEKLSDSEFDKVRPQLLAQYERLVKAPRRNGEEIIVPTGSLFIEALPAETSLMERFKMIHRAVDVKKVQAEVRHAEIENLRIVDRMLHGEREDPDVEKKIVVTGAQRGAVLPIAE
jgi:hypothetical protein